MKKLSLCDKSELLLKAQEFGNKVLDGLHNSVTPFHYIQWAKALLLKNDFEQILEKDIWELTPGKKYFIIRNQSSLFIFTIGKKVDIKNFRFVVIGGHTDSPTLRFAPNAYVEDNTFDKYNLQTYGGGQWQTWFDRDLGLAGKVVVENSETNKLETRLLKISDPILFVPNLCIHLRKEKENFYWNNETHLKAISSTTFFDDDDNSNGKNQENKSSSDMFSRNTNNSNDDITPIEKKIGKKLAKRIASELDVKLSDIFDYNLIMFDTNEAKFTGLNKEFISSARFDNLGTSISGVYAMIESISNIDISDSINICTLFDSEEIGSQTYQGAMSTYFKDLLVRLFSTVFSADTPNTSLFYNNFQAACDRSFILSTDMAHLYHPNYTEYFQDQHRPIPNKGPAIKINCNAKYATECEGSSILKYIAKKNGIPLQDFIVRQDSPCGTTIGPIIAGKCGIKTVDIGCPQLAMHSIREQTAVVDLYYLKNLFVSYLKDFSSSVGDVFEQA